METFKVSVAENIAVLRKKRGFTVRSLADRVSELGKSIHPSGISKMETGTRVPDALEVLALSLAFGVNPSRILLPFTAHSKTEVDVPGDGTVSARDLWEWADGKRPLVIPESNRGAALMDFELNARPPELLRPDASTSEGRAWLFGEPDGEH